ncbi:hypothetical protein K5M76_22680 (plasmid) [Shewanella xiamenensis]|jgi:hypothetical protein|uniref:Uncharacterized protein n=2 Tax=Shewanella TaxID=22 RepID=A0AAE4Q5L5_9GAMM|nr:MULTISPECIES: hypothetical protein [Shewanella]MCK7657723.1 hypothetical protein [Shewanella sp. JNE4-2]MCT8858059.1 hypothetical protein [Shewanella xiamenensis]MDH0451073.1 hypothetical protein [Shewanella sp. GD04112]MDV5393093.1 hypothetical protein [Shewanella xiamenensis]UWG66936.1 hypothetical protein K5M76_22680 [Shewanella xiamenensis]
MQIGYFLTFKHETETFSRINIEDLIDHLKTVDTAIPACIKYELVQEYGCKTLKCTYPDGLVEQIVLCSPLSFEGLQETVSATRLPTIALTIVALQGAGVSIANICLYRKSGKNREELKFNGQHTTFIIGNQTMVDGLDFVVVGLDILETSRVRFTFNSASFDFWDL